jgi:hypothetical protein
MHLPFQLPSQKKLLYNVVLFLGDKIILGLLLFISFGLSLALASSGIVPAFTADVARSVNVSASYATVLQCLQLGLSQYLFMHTCEISITKFSLVTQTKTSTHQLCFGIWEQEQCYLHHPHCISKVKTSYQWFGCHLVLFICARNMMNPFEG